MAARLVQLGAKPFVPVGYGDDNTPNGGVFADFDDWLQNTLLPAMPKKRLDDDEHLLGNSSGFTEDETGRYQVRVTTDHKIKTTNRQEEWRCMDYRSPYQRFFAASCPITAYAYGSLDPPSCPLEGRAVTNRRMTDPEWEQNTRHVTIEVNEIRTDKSRLPYEAGDVAAVMPVNSQDNVSKLLKVLPESIQSIADQEMEIFWVDNDSRDSTSRSKWPQKCTLRGLLTFCADIQALPEREDLWELSFLCDLKHEMGPDQRDKLRSLSDPSGAALFADYVLREKRSWADVLYDFDSVNMTPESLLHLLQPMRPREFSIASAPTLATNSNEQTFQVDLCVAVVEGTTPLGRSYQGLCSNYLARLSSNDAIHLWVRPGSFGKLPLEVTESGRFENPILCIGAGTGIAPLRSLIHEREAVRSSHLPRVIAASMNDGGDQEPDNLLVFGCRQKAMDYYYQDEWKNLVEEKRLALWTAFSRDQWHKIYVQQVVRDAQDGTLIATHLLKKHGAVYVAGGAKMAHCVKDQLLECLAKEIGEKQAAVFLKKLHRLGRYSVEAWS
jgi:sulfite reductase alpha subunit-like flavoprotein